MQRLSSLFPPMARSAGAPAKVTPACTERLDASFEDRISGALWGMHIGDAFGMPAHWFYGGYDQILAQFGEPVTTYKKPPMALPGSIMNKSNTGGGGRGSDQGSIIGDVLVPGKKKYWASGKAYHYHCTLDEGENTLEMDLVRCCYQCISESGGVFDQGMMRERYINFMLDPQSHNDCFVGTCHRMFFANRQRGLPLDKCPDTDGHNVDTLDGMVMTIPVALATMQLPLDAVRQKVTECIAITRLSTKLPRYCTLQAQMLRQLITEGQPLAEVLESAAGRSLEGTLQHPDPVVA